MRIRVQKASKIAGCSPVANGHDPTTMCGSAITPSAAKKPLMTV
jgi:hypothetical protein